MACGYSCKHSVSKYTCVCSLDIHCQYFIGDNFVVQTLRDLTGFFLIFIDISGKSFTEFF